jgi:hypothetical protein
MKRILFLCVLVAGCGKSEFQTKTANAVNDAKAAMNLMEMGTTKGQLDEQFKKLRLTIAEITPKTQEETGWRDTARVLLSKLELYATQIETHSDFERGAGKWAQSNDPTRLKQWREEANKEEAKSRDEIHKLLSKLE